MTPWSAVSIVESLGRLVWLEENLFPAVGEWTTRASDPALREVSVQWSAHHVWRAEQLRVRLHPVGDRSADDFVVPHDSSSALVDLMRSASTDPDRVTLYLGSVLAGLVDGYATLAAGLTTMADVSTIRVVDRVTHDLDADFRSAETMATSITPEWRPHTAKTGGSVWVAGPIVY